MTKTRSPISLWISPIKLPDGHRLFRLGGEHKLKDVGLTMDVLPNRLADNSRGMWAMADDSGEYPHDCDDGVLWLDFRRDLMAGAPVTPRFSGATPGIPLLDMRGTECSTISDPTTMLTLAVKFDWRINCLGTLMKVVRV